MTPQTFSFRRQCVLLVLFCSAITIAASAGMRPSHAEKAMVASVHSLATDAGVEVMRNGGNAIDAAVAAGFALAVVHPQAGNIGGGGFMLIRLANGETHFVDYRETAPAAAKADMYLDKKGDVVPNMSLVGYKAIAVPGSVAGMVYAEKKWGKLTLAKVMEPAIRYAREGFALAWEDADDLKPKPKGSEDENHLPEFADSNRIFERNGNFYKPGELLKQPELARTLERIAADPDSFYHGDL